jgi:GntR family transcriptional regulator
VIGPGDFSLDSASDAPIYRQIIQQIEYGLLSGRMRRGDRLPTIRALAVALKANPNTIARAYGELEIRGVLSTQVGSGTFISTASPPAASEEARAQKVGEVLDRFMKDMRDLGVSRKELARMVKERIKSEAIC